MYHERQRLQLCGLHAVNNLIGEEAFLKKDFDSFVENLAPGVFLNPHKSIFMIGDYDVNVIMTALQTKNYVVQWFDKRKDVRSIHFSAIQGDSYFVLLIQSLP